MFRSFGRFKGERTPSNNSVTTAAHIRHPSEPKTELAITAPKHIVKALYDYEAQHGDELSFSKDEFFYVNEEPNNEWYVASNPLTNQRGLVPVSYFMVIQRQDQQGVPVSKAQHSLNNSSTRSINSLHRGRNSQQYNGMQTSRGLVSSHHASRSVDSRGSSGSRRSSEVLRIYGYMLYDFKAERNDELSVDANESIVIVAQSTAEWFVAKPIGRIGGPGLVPVSYVELREAGTDQVLPDVAETIRRANLPQVDEWKRRLAEYKASSIPLGRFGTMEQLNGDVSYNSSSSSGPSSSVRAPDSSNGYYNAPAYAHESDHSDFQSDVPYVVAATVDRFAINGGRYWYLVKVEMSNGNHRNLCRYYQDFYDFQIKLLEKFPVEAGRTGKQRTLPFMPGPLTLITHSITTQRRVNLDDYVKDLIRMPPYISQSDVVLDLFGVHNGDVESTSGPTEERPTPLDDGADQQYSGDMPEISDNISESSNTSQQFLPMDSGNARSAVDYQRSDGHFVQTRPSGPSYSIHEDTDKCTSPLYQNEPRSAINRRLSFPTEGHVGQQLSVNSERSISEHDHKQRRKSRRNSEGYDADIAGYHEYVGLDERLKHIDQLDEYDALAEPPSMEDPKEVDILKSGLVSPSQGERLGQFFPDNIGAAARRSHFEALYGSDLTEADMLPVEEREARRRETAEREQTAVQKERVAREEEEREYHRLRQQNRLHDELRNVSTATVDDIYREREVQEHRQSRCPSFKIKIFAHGNVIAIRMPVETLFVEVYQKIASRLGEKSPRLYTNAEYSGEPILTAEQFARALNGSTKIVFYLGS